MTLTQLVQKALQEDLPKGDLTTDSLGIKEKQGRSRLLAKEDLVLSGQDFFIASLHALDASLSVHWFYDDGDLVLKDQTVASISGNLLCLLKAERVALNFLGHFSGIATYTRCFVNELEGTKCQILDTRKTLPLYREWDKRAVRHGKGTNHRMNLSEAILIKENHIRVAGGVRSAVEAIRRQTDEPIEIECSKFEEVEEAITLGVRRILLDNMDNSLIEMVMKVVPHSIEIEASGNMSLDRVKPVANLGVHYISVGAITHSAPCADFSLLFDWKP